MANKKKHGMKTFKPFVICCQSSIVDHCATIGKCMWQPKKNFDILVIKKGLLTIKTLVIEKIVATKKSLLMVKIFAIEKGDVWKSGLWWPKTHFSCYKVYGD